MCGNTWAYDGNLQVNFSSKVVVSIQKTIKKHQFKCYVKVLETSQNHFKATFKNVSDAQEKIPLVLYKCPLGTTYVLKHLAKLPTVRPLIAGRAVTGSM